MHADPAKVCEAVANAPHPVISGLGEKAPNVRPSITDARARATEQSNDHDQ
jgi:hypothetical protein